MTSSNQSDSVGSTLGSLGAMTACTLGAGIAGGVLYMAVQRMNRARAASRRLSELIAIATSAGEARIVITGATSGVGEELTRAFSQHSSVSLLLGCRNAERGQRVVEGITRRGGQARLAPLDCLDLGSVKRFAGEASAFLDGGADGLRLLLNNAGVMRAPEEASAGQVTIAGLPAALLARDVVWQTVGAGFAPPFHKRSDSCALDKPPAVAAASRRWLDSRGVRHVDYTSLAEVFAPLMSDSKHFTHYTERCDKLFPELPRLVAQLELQALMGLPAALCPGGVLPPRRRLANSSAGSVSLEHPKGCMLRQGGSCSYYGVKPSLGGRVAAGRAGRTARRSTQRGAV